MKDPDSYASDTDTMVLEDENMRIKLIGNVSSASYLKQLKRGIIIYFYEISKAFIKSKLSIAK